MRPGHVIVRVAQKRCTTLRVQAYVAECFFSFPVKAANAVGILPLS